MELSKITVENRERIKEVLGLTDGSLVKMNENDLLNELLETIEFFDDEDKNKFIPRIKNLSAEISKQQDEIAQLKKELTVAKSIKKEAPAPKVEEKPEAQAEEKDSSSEAESSVESSPEVAQIEKLNDAIKKQISAFLKKKLSVVENGDFESIHPKQKELENEVLKLAKENSDLNTIIVDDMDLIDSLMANLKESKTEWKHANVEKRASKLKHIAVGYEPLGRLFMYKKLLSVPQAELVKE